jgi:hypothetical protein
MNKYLERVNGRHFWNPGVFSYALIPRCRPNSSFFSSFIVTSIVYAIYMPKSYKIFSSKEKERKVFTADFALVNKK